MPNIRVQKIGLEAQGFSGYLAKGRVPSAHGVVVILGGESVMLPFLKLGRAMAVQFAKKGFTAVSVSLFGAEGLPASPDGIPLEYALNAVRFLKESEKCAKIAVFGMSMGSIAALGTAVQSGCVDELVLMSPAHAAFEAVSKDRKTMLGRSFLTLGGKDIPFVRADFSRFPMHGAYEKAYADKEREAAAAAALPVEKTHAKVLLLAGEKDASWPSAYSARFLYDRLESCSFPYPHKLILYPEYGHMLPLKKEAMRPVWDWLGES